ncbi:AMP-dependent synthetase/ligase [Penicillium concentricum]|uniref:AMP-dependent synthetase/ligase n=1 Tax=Penicillium concentricum TaxID=293559 RepID=A0A9W9RV89_9EURO|nr:AMP-dependent synthetase/ligase [Penicillium concentricum]KAJ5365909.1 AMP-dependent synthetase/ligase [Penicillium concentricum]
MGSYRDHHTISVPLDKEVEAAWTDNGEGLLQPHHLKASWALLLGRLSETQTTTFAVLEQLAVPPSDACSSLVALDPHLETWEISDSQDGLLVDAAKERHRAPLSGTQASTGVVIRWRDERNGPILFPCALFNTIIVLDCSVSPVQVSMEYSRKSLTVNQAWSQLTAMVHILGQIVMRSGVSLREVDFLGSYSTGLIRQWNNPYSLARPQVCIHTLILEHCRSQPDAEALCAWDGSITYAELDKFSLAVGLQLLSLGVGPESVVPLYFEKSRWTVVTILGVLRVGAAFVLLDPSHPVARLVEICSEVQATVAIVSESLQELGQQLGPRVIMVLDTIKNYVETGTNTFTTSVKPSNAAYVAFTSGSTGKPKGIVIEHQCFVANTLAQNAVQNINIQTRAFQFASYGFDSSILETLMTLVAGGCVCIPSEQQRLNGLADAIRGLRANWLELTPSVARFINPEEVPDVRSVLLVGEPMAQDHIKQWSGTGKVQLLNAYGPAECSVVTTVQPRVQLEDPNNIGRSYSSHCWIANPHDHNQLEPLGAVGELLISGPIVARGYLNQPQRSFISNPRWATRFGIPPSERVYKTGDLVRYNLEDGTLRYVGRKDREVKIHGQRVDLQEIEQHASQFQKGILAVADVIHLNGSSAGKLLTLFIATADNDETRMTKEIFVVPMNDTLLDLGTGIKQWLRDRLPPYMIPTKLIFVNRFPLTRTGKLDRRALVDLGAASSESPSVKYPSNQRDREDIEMDPELFAREGTLCSVFSEVLGCLERNIGAQDGFYDMGGNSLAAIELVACARKRGLEITVADVIRLQNPRDIARCTVESKDVHEISQFSLLVNTQQSLSTATAQCAIEREMIEDIYPCTPLQEGLMHLSVKNPGAFMGTYRFSLAPSTNLHRIWAAWEQLWVVHPILRTRIIQFQDGQTLQVVTKQKSPWKDISSMDDSQPMNLGTPLARVTFHPGHTSCGSHSGVFILTMHHAIFDGWSYLQLLEDLQVIYNGDRLPPRPAFNHVIKYISKSNAKEAHSFWTQEFNDFQATMFPVSSRRPSASPHWQVRSQQTTLTKSDMDWTLASKIKLAWALVISSQTHSKDVVYGLTVSGRNAPVPEIDRIAGPTFATFPLRTQLDDEMLVKDMLVQMRQHDVSIMPFEHTGLRRIAESSSDAALACGFQNLLTVRLQSLQIPPGALIHLPENEDHDFKFASYPLSIVAQQQGTSLELKAVFDGHILGPHRAEALLGQFDALLQRIFREPGAKMKDLKSQLPPEWQQLAAINKKSLPHPHCLHDIIQGFGASQPNSEAVCAWDGSLTYEKLVALARRLAGHLQSFGSGSEPGGVIGICVERSKWFPVAILGVMMSGAAMVLLEPNFPVQRLRHILGDAGARTIICSPVFQEKCQGMVDDTLVLTPDILTQADYDVWTPSAVSHQDPMYVAFTSGSTGAPKGVVIEHGMVYSMIQAHKDVIGASIASRGLLFASPAFDICLAEIVLILGAGGCVCVPSEAQRMNSLAKTMTTMQVNMAMLTPSVARTLSPAAVPCLQTLILGGEPPSASDLVTWASRVKLHQSYGPAECAMYTTTTAPLTPTSDLGNVGSSPNASCWIVDPDNHDELEPVGSVGELLIGGPIVGRGYINRAQESAAAFIRDPVWSDRFPFLRGHRLYKTGDLALLNADGSLTLVGRKDTQVKLNGQRIELHEIEHCAERYQHGTAVIAELIKPTDVQRPRLIMFVYDPGTVETTVGIASACHDHREVFFPPSTQNQVYLGGVKHHLNQHLPPYMVPSLFLSLSRLPLSPSGKADRKTLREIASKMDRETLEMYLDNPVADKREPVTEQERFVRASFATALSLNEEAVGMDDNFFALGGDSITAMRVLTLCRRRKIAISMQEFLSKNTVSLFCAHAIVIQGEAVDSKRQKLLNAQDSVRGKDQLVQFEHIDYQLDMVRSQLNLLKSDSIEEIYPCSDAHSGVLELYTSNYTSTAIFEISPTGSVTPMQVSNAWSQLVHRHVALRTVLMKEPKVHADYLHVVLDKGPSQILALPRSKNALSELKNLEPVQSWGLSSPHRLMIGEDQSGTVFIRLETGCALIDAFSMTILLEELSLVLQGQPLPEKGVSYRQYLSHLHSQSPTETLQYWTQALYGVHPSHLPRLPATQSDLAESRSQSRSLPFAQSKCLDIFWRSNNLTITNVFQLAWALTLTHYTKSRDVCFGTITSGRDIPDLEVWNIVGSFFNVLPCRIAIDSTRTVLDTLRQNQEDIQRRNDHQYCSTPDIIRKSGIRSLDDGQQLFNTVLTVQNPFSAKSSTTKDGSNEIDIKLIDLEDATEYDLCVAILPSPSNFKVELRYWSTTVSEEYASDILNRLFEQLEQIVQHATKPLSIITGI